MATPHLTNCRNILPEGVTDCSLLSSADSKLACLISGQGDIYGLGIRVGLYLQWFSAVYLFVFDSDSLPELMVANCIVSLGVSISYIVIQAEIFAHEVFIVLMLLGTTVGLAELELLEFIAYVAFNITPPATPNLPDDRIRKFISKMGKPSWTLATAFLVVVFGWMLWSGPATATRCPCCTPLFLKTSFTRPKYLRLYDAIYVILALATFLGLFARSASSIRKMTRQRQVSYLLQSTHCRNDRLIIDLARK